MLEPRPQNADIGYTPISTAELWLDPSLEASAATADDANWVLYSMATYAHAALRSGDGSTYNSWVGMAEQYLAALSAREDAAEAEADVDAEAERNEYFANYGMYLARIYFYGIYPDRGEASNVSRQKLQELLGNEEARNRMEDWPLLEVVQLCAGHGVDPAEWVDCAPDRDGRVRAWARYVYTRGAYAELDGRRLSAEELDAIRELGAREAVEAFIYRSDMSDLTAVDEGSTLYELAKGSVEKQVMIDRYIASIEKLELELPEDDHGRRGEMLRFATKVNIDPAIDPTEKMRLSEAVRVVAESGFDDYAPLYAKFELSRGFDSAASPVREQIDQIIKRLGVRSDKRAVSGFMLRAAVEFYADLGRMDEAAATLAQVQIRSLPGWVAGLEYYVRAGGDIERVVATEGLHDDALRNGHNESQRRSMGARAAVCDYWAYTSPGNLQLERAASAINAMVDYTSEGQPHNSIHFSDTVIPYLDRLLRMAGDQLGRLDLNVQNLLEASIRHPYREEDQVTQLLCEVLLAHGYGDAGEITAWARRRQKANKGTTAVGYFYYGARLALAATGETTE